MANMIPPSTEVIADSEDEDLLELPVRYKSGVVNGGLGEGTPRFVSLLNMR